MNIYNPYILVPLLSLAVFIYYRQPDKSRTTYLLFLSISFLFYMDSHSAAYLLALALFNFGIGLYLERNPDHKNILLISIIFNVLSLAVPHFLKIISIADSNNILEYLIPLGIAYIVLQNIGYLLDVSHKIIPAEHNLIHFLTYILFFPKLLSGPVEAARNFLPQEKQSHQFSMDILQNAAQRILFGLFKKVVIADRLALITQEVFDNPDQYQGLTVITAILFYSFQIYFDFSGYSDIAIGTASLFGYKLTENFAYPYLATNINDFWSRWHISFTSWLREYIFFPLRRCFLKTKVRSKQFLAVFLPLLITMLVSGLWHGFSLPFILWGVFHGFLLFKNEIARKKKKCTDPDSNIFGKRLLTFSLVSFGWIIFRSSSMSDIGLLLRNIFVKSTTYSTLLQEISKMDLVLALGSIPILMVFESKLVDGKKRWMDFSPTFRWVCYFVILFSICAFGVYQPWNTEFIYAGF